MRGLDLQAVGVSPYNCQELEEVGFERPRLMPIAFNRDRVAAAEPDENLLRFYADEAPKILFVGRITPNKCQHDLIRAFSRFRQAVDSRARLFLVGSYQGMEVYCNELLSLIAELGEGNIVISGHVSDSELSAYYQLADLFVCLSEHEGFCVPLLECMHNDLPILAFDSSGVASTLGGSGVLLGDKNPHRVADAMAALTASTVTREAVIAAQRRRLRDFSPEAISPLLQECLEEVMTNA